MTNTAADTERPDRSRFAPDVRLMRLGALREQGEHGEVLSDERAHIVSVEVTRVNTGASQYQVVLNNWNDLLPAQGTGTQRSWPPYRYNCLDVFEFGMRLRIEMRYHTEQQTSGTESVAPEHGWVSMIAGPITDMRFSFLSDQGARLTLIGEDDLNPLKNKSPGAVPYRNKNESYIIQDVLEKARYPLPLATADELPEFFDTPNSGRSEDLTEGQSFLEFLQKIAKRFDCELYVELEELTDKDPAVRLHFRSSRSRQPPDENRREHYVLRRGENLISFNPTLQVFDQYTVVTVRGRHRARNRPARIIKYAKPDILDDELYPRSEDAPQSPASEGSEPSPDSAAAESSQGSEGTEPSSGSEGRRRSLTAGPEVRQHYFGATFGDNDHQISNQTNLDEDRAQAMADAALRQKAREFMRVVGTTIGMPHLRPGVYVEVQGLRAPFDGLYYVEKTVSRFGAGGFTTEFTARRPGMPLPPYEEQ